MPNFESGVSRYVFAKATVGVSFPVDLKGNEWTCCAACRFYRMSARRCALTDEALMHAVDRGVGGLCPRERIEEDETISGTETG